MSEVVEWSVVSPHRRWHITELDMDWIHSWIGLDWMDWVWKMAYHSRSTVRKDQQTTGLTRCMTVGQGAGGRCVCVCPYLRGMQQRKPPCRAVIAKGLTLYCTTGRRDELRYWWLFDWFPRGACHARGAPARSARRRWIDSGLAIIAVYQHWPSQWVSAKCGCHIGQCSSDSLK